MQEVALSNELIPFGTPAVCYSTAPGERTLKMEPLRKFFKEITAEDLAEISVGDTAFIDREMYIVNDTIHTWFKGRITEIDVSGIRISIEYVCPGVMQGSRGLHGVFLVKDENALAGELIEHLTNLPKQGQYLPAEFMYHELWP